MFSVELAFLFAVCVFFIAAWFLAKQKNWQDCSVRKKRDQAYRVTSRFFSRVDRKGASSWLLSAPISLSSTRKFHLEHLILSNCLFLSYSSFFVNSFYFFWFFILMIDYNKPPYGRVILTFCLKKKGKLDCNQITSHASCRENGRLVFNQMTNKGSGEQSTKQRHTVGRKLQYEASSDCSMASGNRCLHFKMPS